MRVYSFRQLLAIINAAVLLVIPVSQLVKTIVLGILIWLFGKITYKIKLEFLFLVLILIVLGVKLKTTFFEFLKK